MCIMSLCFEFGFKDTLHFIVFSSLRKEGETNKCKGIQEARKRTKKDIDSEFVLLHSTVLDYMSNVYMYMHNYIIHLNLKIKGEGSFICHFKSTGL